MAHGPALQNQHLKVVSQLKIPQGRPLREKKRNSGKKKRNSGNNTDKEADTTRRKKHRRKPSWETCQQPRNLACEVNATYFLFPSLLFRKLLFSAHVSTNLSSGKSQIQRKKKGRTYAKQPETYRYNNNESATVANKQKYNTTINAIVSLKARSSFWHNSLL